MIDSNAGPGTSYTDSSVSASSRYNYRVKAVSPTGVSQWSGYVKADTPAAPTPTPTLTPTSTPEPEPETDPADLAPSNLTAALAEGGGVTLSWTAPSEDADSVTGYEVLRAVGEGEMSTLAADTASTAATYADATATGAGETYAYQVKAIRGEDRSQASGQAQVQVPHAPEDLRPTGLTVSLVDSRVTLSWTAPAEDAESVDGYEILRRRPMEGETTLATLVADTESTATTYTDATANEAGVRYVYRVKALRGDEVSLWSNFDIIDLPDDYVAPTPEATSAGLTPATLENTLLGYSEEEEAGTLEPNEVTFDEGATVRVTVVSAWPGFPGLVLMLTAGSSAQDAALADRDFILEADETVLIVGTTEFSFDDATLSHSDTTGDNGEYTGLVIATWAEGEPGLAAGETVAFRLEHRDRPEEAQFSTRETTVPLNWDLRPTGLVASDEFRLLFLTGFAHAPTSTDIADYNAYVQGDLNEFAHPAIRPYASGFRVVGSTDDDDARDNTSTTYTSTNMGLPIYWLAGNKVADDYADFYDGGWDDEANPRHRGGTVRFPTNGEVWTGSDTDGTARGGTSFGNTSVEIGRLNGAGGPLNASTSLSNVSAQSLPYYALSQVFTVGSTANIAPVFTDTAPAARSVAENPGSGTNVGAPVAATDVDTGDTLVYSLAGTDAASFTIVTTSGQFQTKSGVAYNFEAKSSYSVEVKVTDGTHTTNDTATITVTISLTDVNEPPGRPARPVVSEVDGMTDRLNVSWNAPRNTGPAITDYDVQHRVGEGGLWTDLNHTGTGRSATITGLSASDIYDVRVQVRATNPEGTGEWSESGRAPNPENICDRTWWVRNKIVELTPADDTCSSVDLNEIAMITELDFNGYGSAQLREGDFEGLSGLVTLDLSNIGIGSTTDDGSQRLHAGLFAGLTSLETLNLSQNRFYPRIDDGAFRDLVNLTELDLRGFSRNPKGRTGENKGGEGLAICWSNEDKAHLHPEYPWNPRLGSPLAFAPLTSLVTYNYDADFDTSRILQLGDLSEVWNTTVAVTSGSGNRIGYGSAFSGSTLGDTNFTVDGFDGSFTVESLHEVQDGAVYLMTIDFDRALPDDIRTHGVLDIAARTYPFSEATYNSTDYTLTFQPDTTARFVAGSSYTVNIKARALISRYGDYSPRAYRTNNYNQPPPAPVNLTKSVSDDNVVTLNWDAPAVSGITGYIIEREVDGRGYDWMLPQIDGTGPNAPCSGFRSSRFTYFGLPGNEVGTPTGTSFTYDVGATGLLKFGRTISSLKFHVYTVVNNNRSLPTTINVGAL